MRRRALLGALGTAGLGGCLRLEGGSGTTATTGSDGTTVASTTASDDPTSTQASTTTRTTDPDGNDDEDTATTERPEEASYPTGLSDDGVDQFLWDAHTRALTGTSCRTSWRKLNHTEGSIDREKTYDVDSGAALGEWTTSEGGSVEMYRDGNSGLWRERFGDEDIYGQDEVGFAWRKVSWGVEVQPQLTAWTWETPERVNDARPAVWEVTASGVADASTPPGDHEGTVRSLDEATMRVNEDGVILELESRYTIDEGESGQTLTYESSFRTQASDGASVSEPSWLSMARDRMPVASARYTDDRRFVEFELTSGGPLVGDSRIVLVPDAGSQERREVEFSDPLEPGTRVSLWHDESDPYRRLRLSRGSPPSDASPVQLGDTHEVYLYRDARVYAPPFPVE